MTPKYGVGSTWTTSDGTEATIIDISDTQYTVKWGNIQFPHKYAFETIENHLSAIIESGCLHSLVPFLEVGKVYWSKKKDSSVWFWRKYFGNDQWGLLEDHKEHAEAHTEPYSKNTGQITVIFSESPKAPAKKKPRCLNPPVDNPA